MTTTLETSAAAVGKIDKHNPRNGALLYSFQEPSDAELEAVMQRARAAYEKVSQMSIAARVQEILKLSRYLVEHKDAIAAKLIAENGKCLCDAMIGDIFTCLDLIDYYAKNAEKLLGDEKVVTPLMLFPKKSKIIYSPLGPALIISPWNYPLNTALTPAVCAFIAGNSVIMKPSEWTPMKGLLDEIVTGSGFMKDALQVVFGGRATGSKLIDLKPAKVFFTGSVRGGKEILKHCSEYLIPVELELGGKDPMLVFEDASMERATNGAVWGALNNTGQGCTSVERCFVQESIYDEFVTTLKEKFAKLSTTDTFKGGEDCGNMDIGCITTPFQLQKIAGQVDEARAKGADVWQAYAPVAGSSNYPPTIITNVNNSMEVQVEETFGPVITIAKFRTEEEAIRLANDTPYGLSSSVWTRDLVKADRIARRIDAGNVCINDVMVTEGNSALPFGGVKQSGIGRYKSRVGVHNFCNIKSVMVDTGTKPSEAHWYPYTKEKYNVLVGVIDAHTKGGIGGLIKVLLSALKLESLLKKQKL
jgi:acyl-CoA reductase-like NAD-dependent aldehyde dehydrogenase